MKTMNGLRHRLNLQLHAEGAEGGGEEGAKESYDDLVAKIASLEAEKKRYKDASDRNASQASEYKKKLQEKMSESEKEAESLKENETARNAELESLRRELGEIKLTAKFTNLGMSEELAKDCSLALLEGDNDKLFDRLSKYVENVKTTAQQDFLNSRPGIKSGVGAKESNESEAVRWAKERNKSNVKKDYSTLLDKYKA